MTPERYWSNLKSTTLTVLHLESWLRDSWHSLPIGSRGRYIAPPAKVRFDSTHPIVSIRVNQELKQQLDEIKEMSGKSAGDILREALKVQAYV